MALRQRGAHAQESIQRRADRGDPPRADRTSVAEAAKKNKVSEQAIYIWRKHGDLASTPSSFPASGLSDARSHPRRRGRIQSLVAYLVDSRRTVPVASTSSGRRSELGRWTAAPAYDSACSLSDACRQSTPRMRSLPRVGARPTRRRGPHCLPHRAVSRTMRGTLAACLGKHHMPRRQQVTVEPRPDGRWAVQTDGTQRADSLHLRKSDALRRGRELAENKRTELVIKNEAGRIIGKDSHGKDPRRIPG